MQTYTSALGREYQIDDKHLIWKTTEWDDEPSIELRLPLRMKLSVLKEFQNASDRDPFALIGLFTSLWPKYADTISDLDPNELQELFQAFNERYMERNGGLSLGEAQPSPDSSPSIAER